jgi:hypothetical protein
MTRFEEQVNFRCSIVDWSIVIDEPIDDPIENRISKIDPVKIPSVTEVSRLERAAAIPGTSE